LQEESADKGWRGLFTTKAVKEWRILLGAAAKTMCLEHQLGHSEMPQKARQHPGSLLPTKEPRVSRSLRPRVFQSGFCGCALALEIAHSIQECSYSQLHWLRSQ